jgi:hypothetical protein
MKKKLEDSKCSGGDLAWGSMDTEKKAAVVAAMEALTTALNK